MCGNRVEELESRVKELEASVEGLTDELVECKVRIRELEEAVDDDLEFASMDVETQTQFEAESSEPDRADQETTESVEDDADDIIVA